MVESASDDLARLGADQRCEQVAHPRREVDPVRPAWTRRSPHRPRALRAARRFPSEAGRASSRRRRSARGRRRRTARGSGRARRRHPAPRHGSARSTRRKPGPHRLPGVRRRIEMLEVARARENREFDRVAGLERRIAVAQAHGDRDDSVLLTVHQELRDASGRRSIGTPGGTAPGAGPGSRRAAPRRRSG